MQLRAELPPGVRLTRVHAAAGMLCLLLSAVASAQSRPIAHEDVWLMRRIGSPALTRDGRTAVFSVTEPAYDEKDQVADLWVVPTDGTQPPRRLTATRGAESGPAFSPDGKRVAFSARRDTDDVAQIYVIDLGGGEAQRATSVSTGARAPVWRPDGRAILFTSDVYPAARTDEDNRKAADERKKRKWSARVYDSFPIRDWDRWLDDRRPTLMVQALEPGTPATDARRVPARRRAGVRGAMGHRRR